MRAELLARVPEAHFVGQRSGDDLATHYASLDVFLFPSLTGPLATSPPEALASGCAVAAFTSGSGRS